MRAPVSTDWFMAGAEVPGESDAMAVHSLVHTVELAAGSRRFEGAALRRFGWLVFLVIALAVALGAGFAGDERSVSSFLTGLGLATTAAILFGIALNQPAKPLPWQLLALCTLLTTAGDPFTKTADLVLVGQVLAAAGSLAGFVGFVMLIRGRIPGGDRAALLDAAILASGTGVLIWAFGFGPLFVAGGQTSIVSAALFYPTLIALTMVARMWFLDGAHRPATRLIVLLVVASNAIIVLDMLGGVIGDGALTAPRLLANFAELAFLGSAALHPAMAISPERQRADLHPISRRRIGALTAALLVGPATFAIEVAGRGSIDPAPYLAGSVVIGVLVIARLSDALRRLGDSLRERESLLELLRRQALYDSLTSLPNRTYFAERLASQFANRSADRLLAVLLIDLDDFKAVNDSYGHETGDAVLIAVGQRLRAAIRAGDMAARLGGDEFVIALPACGHPDVAIRLAERILEALAEPVDISGRRITVHASVGVTVASNDDRTADDVVRNADVAMYFAKGRGKDRFEVFEPSMQAAAALQLQLRTDLAAGIAAGDLRLHYQPVVDLRSGRTIGYEALVRWWRDGRLVAPGEFIPTAEATGLIGPLTDWVVDEACRTTAGWGEPGDRQWVSVNLSSSQLVRHDMVARLGRTLRATGLPPERLVIEITESSLVEIDVARPAIERLTDIGVRIAIDDFGTGYSALSYLARLPIDIIKIDRSFVIALQQPGPEQAIAAAIIALATQLGLTTIGEGIETAAQLHQLAALGCDLGQGYYLGRPAAGAAPRPALDPQARLPRLTAVGSLSA
jgi:diguanylate cyclase (GGDEF)-like protein